MHTSVFEIDSIRSAHVDTTDQTETDANHSRTLVHAAAKFNYDIANLSVSAHAVLVQFVRAQQEGVRSVVVGFSV